MVSALPPEADIDRRAYDVRFGSKAAVHQSNPAPSALAVTGNVDYGVDDDTGRDGDQVRYETEVDA